MFILDQRLQQDCFALGHKSNIRILLLNNSLVPWFLLVPEVEVQELFQLTANQRTQLRELQDQISRFVLDSFDVQKLNVAAIGNVVSQLHIHVIGRKPGDYCWPDVVWGNPNKQTYSDDVVSDIRKKLQRFIADTESEA